MTPDQMTPGQINNMKAITLNAVNKAIAFLGRDLTDAEMEIIIAACFEFVFEPHAESGALH